MNENLTNLRTTVETILRCDLAEAIGIADEAEAEAHIQRLLHAIGGNQAAPSALARFIDPQWVVLAAGKGTRMDPSSRLNKNLDVWFGEQNILHLSRKYLPGSRPHIVVINPQMAERVTITEVPLNGMIPAAALDMETVDRLFGPNVILCVQPQPNGTGGALHAALPAIRESGGEFIGVAFGDEPFLNQAIFLQTLISHFIAEADVTLCGKAPETVVDKGGLFFDSDGKFIGTKEWYDMTDAEKAEMWRRLERGEAYTNTGITLIRREAAIARMARLQPHGSKSELHHVDLIRHCYEDGLKTHAYIYPGEIVSGVNRWSNVLTGEALLFEGARQQLSQRGIRLDPAAQITLASEGSEIGYGCYLLGRVHLGEGVQIGNYCRLENVVLLGNTTVGDLVGLKDVRATDTVFESNPLPTEVGAPITGLAVCCQIENSQFDRVKVGHSVHLRFVDASATVIPAGMSMRNIQLGIPEYANMRISEWANGRITTHHSPLTKITHHAIRNASQFPNSPISQIALDQLTLPGYKPGVFTFGEKRGMPDWENLRRHVRSHSEGELIERATRNPTLRQVAVNAVNDLLEMQKADGTYVIDDFTPEELWGSIFELVTRCTGNPDPYRRDKLRARQTAMNLIDEFSECEPLARLKLVIAANVIDYSSSRVVAKLREQPDYFDRVLRAALHAPLAIDCFDRFRSMVIEGEPKRLIWLIDNDGEAVFDLWLIQMLAERGHQITVVGKEAPASNDATLDDLREIVAHPRFQTLQNQIALGDVSTMSSGSKTIGTNLYQASAAFANALLDADLVISKGQGNFYTTQGLRRDAFYLLLCKGMTAEQTTGVVPERSKVIDGLILAYVPGGTRLDGTLKEFCSAMLH